MSEELKIENSIEADLADAIAKAKQFHPVTKLFVNGYTGEISQYKTPDNYIPDEGVVNDMPDLCHTEDYVSIAQIYERLKHIKALSLQDSDFDFNEDEISANDLDEVTLSDVVSEVDDPSDYENIVEPFYDEKYGQGQAQDNAQVDKPVEAEEQAEQSESA